MRSSFVLRYAGPVAAIFLASCTSDRSIPTQPQLSQADVSPASTRSEKIAGEYIVRLRNEVTDVPRVATGIAWAHGGTVGYVYTHAIKGFSIRLSDAAAAALLNHPEVLYIEQNQTYHAITEQLNATWGIDRIDQRDRPLSGSYVYNADGTGVNAYIIDTGIRLTHSQFEGRAISGIDKVDNDNDATDCNGHGTHVSGTVGGKDYGVAKKVALIGVRVLDCGGSGTTAGVIAGINWVTADHQPGGSRAGQPAVANMSLGGGFSQTLNDAVKGSVNAGVVYAVAAGNGFFGYGYDPCLGSAVSTDSPASEESALTVGATDINDKEAVWSNRGPCVDIFAPGVSITSAWLTDDNATNTISGTSMATPHVAGAAALYLQAHPSATAAEVDEALSVNASVGKITFTDQAGWKTAPQGNWLLYTAFISAGPPPAPTPPNAPSNTSTKPASSSSAIVMWTDNSGNEDGFRVERSVDGGASWEVATTTGANATSYTDGGRTAELPVCYRVIAFNGVGDSAPSNTSCTTPPAAPSGLMAVPGTPAYGQIKLSWTDNSSVEDNQEILRCQGTSCTPTSVIATVAANASSYDDNSVAGSTTYSYRVRAKKDGGTSDPSETASATTDANPNQAPVAKYTWNCGGKQGRSCSFNSTSTDDGAIIAWSWNFGDGATASGSSTSHMFGARGTYNVSLTVTDNGSPALTGSRVCALKTGTSGTCQ